MLEVGGWRLEVGGFVLRVVYHSFAEAFYSNFFTAPFLKTTVLLSEPPTSNLQPLFMFMILELQVFPAAWTAMGTADAGETELFQEAGSNDTGR